MAFFFFFLGFPVTEFSYDELRWETTKGWLRNIIKTIVKRFRWGFVVAGSIALVMAGISWKMEGSQSYWIWHRYEL